jgi:hypothetical protein
VRSKTCVFAISLLVHSIQLTIHAWVVVGHSNNLYMNVSCHLGGCQVLRSCRCLGGLQVSWAAAKCEYRNVK